MKKTLGLLVCGLLWMGCDEPKAKGAASEPAVNKGAEEKVAGPAAEAKEAAPKAAAEPLKPIKEPLFGDVALGFDHHVLMDKEQQIAEVKQRTLMLESAGVPLTEALSKLESDLVAAGFTKRDSQDVQGSLIRGYHRNGDLSKAGGQVINISAGAYEQEKDGRTGTFSITLKQNVGK